MQISMQTTIGEIVSVPALFDVCKRVGGKLFENPAILSAETMTLERIAPLIGAQGEVMISHFIKSVNAILSEMPEEDFLVKTDDGVSSAKPLSEEATKEERAERAKPRDAIYPGKVWYDTKGDRIQAHGGCIFYERGTYYWLGENKDYTRREGKVWTWGVKIYSSKDLYNWTDEGYLIEPELSDKTSLFYPVRRLDRPHLLFNERTKKYVLWLKYCDDAHYTVLTSDSLKGKYEVVSAVYRPFGVNCGDFDLYRDENGQGYLYFEVNHTDVWGVKLSDDYTEVLGEPSKIYEGLQPPFAREGIAHMARKGKHYLFTSGMTGYVPNPSEVAVSNDPLTGYKVLGDPHVDDESSASFNSQFCCIFQVAGRDQYIACADRWVPEFVMTREKYDVIVRAITSRTDPSVKVTEEEKRSLAEMPLMGTANTSIADYVWLPIEFEGEMPRIRWQEEWRI